MVRQCAWCLRLIDETGEPISGMPMPKRYDASHGMCRTCGARWMASTEALESRESEAAAAMVPGENPGSQNGIMMTPRPDEMARPLPLRRVFPPEPLQPEEANNQVHEVDKVQSAELCFAC